MSNEVKIELTADEGKLINSLRRGEGAARTFGSSVRGVFHNINDAANKTFGTFGKITAALGSGIVLKKLFSLEEFEKVDDALLMMQANLHMNARELENFKNKASKLPGALGEDMGTVFAGISRLSKFYKPDDILKITDASSMAAHAMEQDLAGVEETIVRIMKMYHKTPDEAKEIAQALAASNLDTGTLDTVLQRGVLKGAASENYKDVLAMLSALKKRGVDSTRAAMAVESIMLAVGEKQKVMKQDLGIDLFKIDPSGKKVKKSIDQVMAQMQPAMEKWRKKLGDEKFNELTDRIFGPGAHEGFKLLFGDIGAVTEALKEQNRAGEIAAERMAAAENKWGEQFDKIKGNLAAIKTDLSWIYDIAKKPVKFLADSPLLTKTLGLGAAGLTATVLLGMGIGKGREFLKNLKGTGMGVAEGLALESVTGVKPVFVTNWPGGFGGSGSANGGLGTRDIDLATGPGAAAGVSALATAANIGIASIPAIVLGGSYALSRIQREASAGLRRWRTENPYDYEKSKEVMGGKVDNNISLHVYVTPEQIRTDTDDLNTKIQVNRGSLR